MKHITQAAICQLANAGVIQTVDAACDKVGFCDEYGAGVYCVLDCSGAGARCEITRKVPPQVRFFTKFRTTTTFLT
jgi:hypothetical protein